MTSTMNSTNPTADHDTTAAQDTAADHDTTAAQEGPEPIVLSADDVEAIGRELDAIRDRLVAEHAGEAVCESVGSAEKELRSRVPRCDVVERSIVDDLPSGGVHDAHVDSALARQPT